MFRCLVALLFMHACFGLDMSETVTLHTLGPLQIDGARMIHIL